MKQETIEARQRGDLNRGIAVAIAESSMGDSPASHEGTDDLSPDPRDDEQITVTRRQLRIMVRTILELELKDYVRLDAITTKELSA